MRLGLGRPEYEPIEPERCRFSVSPTVDRDTRGRDICLTIDQVLGLGLGVGVGIGLGVGFGLRDELPLTPNPNP